MNLQIGELAKRTACPVVTIRYYEREGLLPLARRSQGNFRLYGEAHVERLQFILRCRSLDMPLSDVRTLLSYRDSPTQDCGEVNALLDERIREVKSRIDALRELEHQLADLSDACSGARPVEACGILQGLSGCACDARGAIAPVE
ncbi:transcriptional regulator [Alicycliphilus denitrificans]|jgi:Cd(II)/Pb(II)-responsive transcriptional regulator|uniref:Cd(II)/Pb(II)-responsive transcriptional regulator n=1 Tax=Alicycliphilus denitrificans TaxID=179636 RepID=UPI001914F7FB|nr:Cd(II)/Pb(II)-responsive transcriptional regulator [Alicycliphilus denitrificans]MBN9575699.1 Cd(II)/Pb(II)-responsive transcriptional regulator [Alicycliphilus denitrificans]MBS0495994.1 Cd(II)/Pb(II)-responsive transcriptional regulator [Pseudomonadota bacterium]BCN39560.1 transcriptional regulator [Alicycliphilus denitrificans]